MTMVKAVSVIAVLSSFIAAPVFARDAEPMRHDGLGIHRGLTHHFLRDQHFRGAYNQRTSISTLSFRETQTTLVSGDAIPRGSAGKTPTFIHRPTDRPAC